MTITVEIEPEAVPILGGFPHVSALPYDARSIAELDQRSAGFEADLQQYESSCRLAVLSGITDKTGQDSLAKLWADGVGVLNLIATWQFVAKIIPSVVSVHPYGFAAMAKVAPKITSAMTTLAAAWLTPRSQVEPRGALYERIAALRPVEQNKQLQELMEKNNEGAITPAEYAELVRLNEFFDTLQAIIDDAITSTHQKVS